jgi:hypothetical protein
VSRGNEERTLSAGVRVSGAYLGHEGARCRPRGEGAEWRRSAMNPTRNGVGWLKNGNPPGDYATAPRCRAMTRDRTTCRGPAMRNGRCRMHGGKSTGPRTPEGLERSRRANWKHGAYSREVRELLATNRRQWQELWAALRSC